MAKGQMLTLEQMILFSAGVVITVTVFSIFSTISENVRGEAQIDQMNEVGSLVASAIAASAQTQESSLRVLIPDKIGGESYTIDLSSQNVTITTSDTRVDVPLEGVGSANSLSGSISSAAGRVVITKVSGTISITR